MSATIAIIDNQDETATVSITGEAGATHTAYMSDWKGALSPAAFASVGSRVGDGDITVATPGGGHLLYVSSTLGGIAESVSSMAAFVSYSVSGASDAEDDVPNDIADEIITRLKALGLVAIPLANIVRQKLPFLDAGNSPGVCVVPVPERFEPWSTNRDKVVYGYQVTVHQPSNRDTTSDQDRLGIWRARIEGAFRQQPTDVGVNTAIEPGPVVDPIAFRNQYDASSLVLRVETHRTRGRT